MNPESAVQGGLLEGMLIGRPLLAATGLLALTVLGSAPAGAEPSIPTDEQGYVGTEAHCDSTQLAVAYGRTARSLVAICTLPEGGYEYRGVRISDEAGLTLDAGAIEGGFVADNDGGVKYTVTPQQLLVTDGDKVIYRDTWVEFQQPRFSSDTITPSTTSPSTASPTTTSPTTTTVRPAAG